MSAKVLQTGAFHLENGMPGVDQSPGWGAAGSEHVLGAGDAVPWLQWPRGKTINQVDDNSIIGDAFKDTPRKVTEYVEKPISFHSRFDGMDPFYFWAFGAETNTLPVVATRLNTPSVDPTYGAIYEDSSLNQFEFLRIENWNNDTLYIFRVLDGVAPATGQLDKVSGTGDAVLVLSSYSSVLYEHVYELDSRGRHFMDYDVDERVTGWASGAKKNRMATIGIKMGTSDYRYKNAMCKSFGFRSNAGQMSEFFGDFIAYDEERGSYNSAAWTTPATRDGNDNVIIHHDLMVQLGSSAGSVVSLGATSVELGCQIPLIIDQDTLSGVHLTEPVLEGKYDISLGMTLSRHASATWQQYRDNWTKLVARIAANQGFLMSEYLFEELVISEAGPDESDVAREPLVMHAGYVGSSNWASHLAGNTLIHNGPMLLRVRNTSSANQMFAN